MSGRYPIHQGLQHGVIPPTYPYGLPLEDSIIPQEMLRAGYTTHMAVFCPSLFFVFLNHRTFLLLQLTIDCTRGDTIHTKTNVCPISMS